MQRATISVVIPLYNKAPHIQRALDSVFQQTTPAAEIIVVDDGSTDESSDIVRANSDPRLRLIGQQNAGVSAARNRGIAEAQGALIAFLDADDAWQPAFLATVQRLHHAFPEAGMYATAYTIGQAKGILMQPEFAYVPKAPWEGIIPNYFKASLGASPISSSSVAIPKAIFDDVGNFPVGVHRGEDLDMWLRIALKHPVAFSSTAQAIVFQDTIQRSSVRYPMKTEAFVIQTAKQALQRGSVPRYLHHDLLEYIAKYQIQIASECVITGHTIIARQLLQSCRQTKHFRTRWIWWYFWAALPDPLFTALWSMRKVFSNIPKG
jgi:glycosyltransferase involved in cell wall biosynthesis